MATPKRKPSELTLKEKQQIIDAYKTVPNLSKVARKMSKKLDMEVKYTTVRQILNRKHAIEAAIKSGVPLKRTTPFPHVYHAHYPKLEERVLIWLDQARALNQPIRGNLIQEKAMQLAEIMEITSFDASEKWLRDFTIRYGIVLKAVQEREQSLPDLHEVFNLDEMGAFWQVFLNEGESKQTVNAVSEFLDETDERQDGLTMEDIAEEMLGNKEPKAKCDVEEEIALEEAHRAWSTVRKFMQQKSGKKYRVMQACDRIKDEFCNIRRKTMRQPKEAPKMLQVPPRPPPPIMENVAVVEVVKPPNMTVIALHDHGYARPSVPVVPITKYYSWR